MPFANPRLPAERGFDARDKIITIHVGDPPKSFFLHRAVLCSSSEYFKARFKPAWSKTGAAPLKLRDHDPAAFNVYINWLYMRGIPLADHVTAQDGGYASDLELLAATFAVGEYVMDYLFKDTVMDAMRAKLCGSHGATIWTCVESVVATIYNSTPTGSPARKLLLDVFTGRASDDETGLNEESLPKEFLWDLTEAYKSRSWLSRSWLRAREGAMHRHVSRSKCAYHSHRDREVCYVSTLQAAETALENEQSDDEGENAKSDDMGLAVWE